MSRDIHIAGAFEGAEIEVDGFLRFGNQSVNITPGTVTPAARLSSRFRWRLEGLTPPGGGGGDTDPPDDTDDDGGDGSGTGGNPTPPPDPALSNPADHIEADFVGPSGSKVPDLSLIYVTATRKSGPAPLGVAFQLRSTDPNFHNFIMFGTAEWSFSGDTDENYPFQYLTEGLAGDTAGTARGPYVAHTYVTPGTHSWSVTLRYPGLAPRTITNTAVLVTRADLPENLRAAGVDMPAWLGMTAGTRDYTMTAVGASAGNGGRINVTLTNGHGTAVLRNIAIPDGATGAQVAEAIVAASAPAVSTVCSRVGVSFTSSGATLTATSSCPLGTTTVTIGAGDPSGVTWTGGAPDFSTAAPANASAAFYRMAPITTGGVVSLTISHSGGSVIIPRIYLPTGATEWDVAYAIADAMEANKAALNAIRISAWKGSFVRVGGVDTGRLTFATRSGGVAAPGPVTFAFGTPAEDAAVTWASGAPNTSTTVPAATGGSITTIAVSDPDTFFAGRTVYCSTAYASGAALQAAAASLGIPADLAPDRYYGGPEAYFTAANSRGGLTGDPWRIMLHAGQTYTVADGARRPKTVNTYVTRFGTGANPVITIGAGFVQSALMNYQDSSQRGWGTFASIDFIGLYDSANPGFSSPWMSNLFQLNSIRNYGLTIHSCRMQGWRTNVSVTSGGITGLVISNCDLTSWYDFGMYPNATHASGFAGLSIKQKVGTINVGRKSTSLANTGDRYTYEPAALYTSKFDWALGAPVPNSGAPAIPTGYEAPASGLWGEHPAGAEAWAWWKANWNSFAWPSKLQSEAFKNADNDLYRDCAVHGPVRSSTPGFGHGWHQCEFRSLNGWSRSGTYNKALPDLQQQEDAFAPQPCMRLHTAMGSNGVTPGQTAAMWRCWHDAGGSAIAAVPERNSQPTSDRWTRGPGILLDEQIGIARLSSSTLFTSKYARVCLRNSVGVFRGTAPTPENLIFFAGADGDEPTGSAYRYVYNNTVIYDRNLMAASPNSNFGFASIVQRRTGARGVVQWNNLAVLTDAAYIRNAADFASPGFFAPLGDTTDETGDLNVGFVPEPGSAALGDASDLAPYYDAAGNIRPAAASLGAYEDQNAPAFTAETAYFGALTLAGDGGFAVQDGATSVTDADGTNLQITSGALVPATNGVTAGTVTYDNAGTVAVTTVTDTYSIKDTSDIAAVLALGTATYATRNVIPQAGNTQKGLLAGTAGRVVFGGIDSGDLTGKDWSIYLDFQFNNVSTEVILLAIDIGRAIRVRLNSAKRLGVADTVSFVDGTTVLTAGRWRLVITHNFATSTLNAWIKPVGGSTTQEINAATKTFNGTRTIGATLGYVSTGNAWTVSVASNQFFYDAAVYDDDVPEATRNALLDGADPQAYATNLIWHPSLGEPLIRNRQSSAKRMVAQDGAVTTGIVTSAHTNNASGPNNFVILRDPETGVPIQYDKGAGLRYWAICETGSKANVELMSSSNLTTWVYDSTIFTASGLTQEEAYPCDFIYLGNIAGGHNPFFVYLTTKATGSSDRLVRLYTSSNMTAWTADAANPVYSHIGSSSNGTEDFRVLRTAAGTWWAVYETNGRENNGANAIASATNVNTVPTGAWTVAADPLFSAVDAGFTGSTEFIANPCCIRRGGRYWVFYEALKSASDVRCFLRSSTDLVNWTEWGQVAGIGSIPNTVIWDGGQMWVYCANSSGNAVHRFPFNPIRTRFGPDIEPVL